MNSSNTETTENPFIERLKNTANAPGAEPKTALPAETLPLVKANKEPILLSNEGSLELHSIESVFRLGKLLWLSRLLPQSFKSPEQVTVALLRALELKLPPLQALEGMTVINNRVGIMGDLALAMVESSGLLVDKKVRYSGEEDTLKCVITLQRKGREAQSYSFSIAEARAAGIYERSVTWHQYPRRMTYYRALGFALRDEFSDVLKGIKTTEELMDYPEAGSLPVTNTNHGLDVQSQETE